MLSIALPLAYILLWSPGQTSIRLSGNSILFQYSLETLIDKKMVGYGSGGDLCQGMNVRLDSAIWTLETKAGGVRRSVSWILQILWRWHVSRWMWPVWTSCSLSSGYNCDGNGYPQKLLVVLKGSLLAVLPSSGSISNFNSQTESEIKVCILLIDTPLTTTHHF